MSEKETLLDLLLASPQEFVSGEEISRRLSVSRTAVWKQINKLREAGYEFEAVPHKGYRILNKPERLETLSLIEAFKTNTIGKKLKVLESTISTQEEARVLAEAGAPEGTLVIAEEQTGGRGRMGRRWLSPKGKGIWMSLLLRPKQPLHCMPQLTLLTGVAVCRAVRRTTGVMAGLKWPNDLLVNGRKISGILLESAAEDEYVRYCITGIGISANLDMDDYPEELKDAATSLKIEAGEKVDRVQLIAAVWEEFEALYALYQEEGFGPIASLWEALSVTLGKPVTVYTASGPVSGKADKLDPSGALLVITDDGRRVPVFSGDVKLSR
ncbi:biotin--[acetyl-CoA-carboxylase] ligase [Paenibacillus sp.]|jgi:BirA family biotin operon repressor/biotin-[acetyl-CoA-carboxylase] ligase|uniref:biotin--[acetyl-CoA-carboxylase] ligase n=1 Tax=Paenibacillus sp. TaxID=58172 RepID=UPI00282DE781|nr:biotin--[acetyl-CoA-carboxylase] ligase [Paenibacillus sp.]MDR0271569.1 biotin--[acetyl-CoA-carboxylase] ligase [Paenibacillus sp.]